MRMSPLEVPTTIDVHNRYNSTGSRVDPPTRAAQKLGKLLIRRGPVRTCASYRVGVSVSYFEQPYKVRPSSTGGVTSFITLPKIRHGEFVTSPTYLLKFLFDGAVPVCKPSSIRYKFGGH